MPAMRRILIVTFPGIQTLDVVGPTEVFEIADRLAGGGAYQVETVATSRDPIESSSGMPLIPRRALDARAARSTRCSWPAGPARERSDERLVAGSARGRARAGWRPCAPARSCWPRPACSTAAAPPRTGPRVTLLRRTRPPWSSEPIFVRDGDVFTSAGVTAGMDLALALVEEDLGADVARRSRAGSCCSSGVPAARHSSAPSLGAGRAGPLRDLQPWIAENLTPTCRSPPWPSGAHEPPQLRPRVPREVGMTPAAYVESAGSSARGRTGVGDAPSTRSPPCGFGTAETLRRAFHRGFASPPPTTAAASAPEERRTIRSPSRCTTASPR